MNLLRGRRSPTHDALQRAYNEAYQASVQAIMLETSNEPDQALQAWSNTLLCISSGLAGLQGAVPKSAQEQSLMASILDIERQCHDRMSFLKSKRFAPTNPYVTGYQYGSSSDVSNSRPSTIIPVSGSSTASSPAYPDRVPPTDQNNRFGLPDVKVSRMNISSILQQKQQAPSSPRPSGRNPFARPNSIAVPDRNPDRQFADFDFQPETDKSLSPQPVAQSPSRSISDSLSGPYRPRPPVPPPHRNLPDSSPIPPPRPPKVPLIDSSFVNAPGVWPAPNVAESGVQGGGRTGHQNDQHNDQQKVEQAVPNPVQSQFTRSDSSLGQSDSESSKSSRESLSGASAAGSQDYTLRGTQSNTMFANASPPKRQLLKTLRSGVSSGKRSGPFAGTAATLAWERPKAERAASLTGFDKLTISKSRHSSDGQLLSPVSTPGSTSAGSLVKPPVRSTGSLTSAPRLKPATRSVAPKPAPKTVAKAPVAKPVRVVPKTSITPATRPATTTAKSSATVRTVKPGPPQSSVSVPNLKPGTPVSRARSPKSATPRSPVRKKPVEVTIGGDRQPDDEEQGELSDWDKKIKDIMANLKGVDEAAAKQVMNEVVIKGDEVHWADIAGLEQAKASLKETVVYPFLRPDLFSGLREPASGMLLFGPPGTGKTMLARAVATESHSTFFSISASSLTSKFLGESEKLVRALFHMAKALAPSIIFVDEIDSLLSSRSDSGEHEASRRIKNEFLVQWSNLQHAAAGQDRGQVERVLVLAATNLPWAIDEAARRRFVRRQYIPLPEAETRKLQISRLLSHQKHALTEEDFARLLELTEGFSGSDITALAKDAALGPIRALGDLLLTTPTEQVRPISFQDFVDSSKLIRPSVSKEGLSQFEDWAALYGSSGA